MATYWCIRCLSEACTHAQDAARGLNVEQTQAYQAPAEITYCRAWPTEGGKSWQLRCPDGSPCSDGACTVGEQCPRAPILPRAEPACANCRFATDGGAPLRNCRRRGPALDVRTGRAAWPVVSHDDWCGEWESR